MKNAFKKTLRELIPPVFLKFAKKIIADDQYEYVGNFPDWQSALAKSSGYDDKAVFEKVKQARMRVLSGEKKYERDSSVFDSVHYFWPLLASLLYATVQENNRLSVLDFGGSLGSTYFQNLAFLKDIRDFSWGVVEQKHFVEFGKKSVESGALTFYETVDECVAQNKPNVAVISSSLQYVENAYKILGEIKKQNFKFIIFDRTTIVEMERDLLTIQHVPKRIYDARFPVWFLSQEKLVDFLKDSYELVEEWASIGDPLRFSEARGRYKGFLFRRKS